MWDTLSVSSDFLNYSTCERTYIDKALRFRSDFFFLSSRLQRNILQTQVIVNSICWIFSCLLYPLCSGLYWLKSFQGCLVRIFSTNQPFFFCSFLLSFLPFPSPPLLSFFVLKYSLACIPGRVALNSWSPCFSSWELGWPDYTYSQAQLQFGVSFSVCPLSCFVPGLLLSARLGECISKDCTNG